MYCMNCGQLIVDNARFCGNCGAELMYITTPPTPPYGDPYPPASAYSPDRGIWNTFFTMKGRLNPKRFMIRFSFLMLIYTLLMFVLAVLVLSQQDQDTYSMIGFGITALFYTMLIPMGVRRCHDLGRPGWYLIFLAIPPILVFLECAYERLGWYSSWGIWHEVRRISSGTLMFGFIAAMIASMFAMLTFAFSS